jgi:ABC-type dipeptide/oligopeptide/nickel transport system permease component
MLTFFIKKFQQGALTFLAVATLVFFMTHLSPGSPFIDEHLLHDETLEIFKNHFGLNKPLFTQYLLFLKGIFSFNLGPSLVSEQTLVMDIIKQAFPVSLSLGALAFIFALIIGFSISILRVFVLNKFLKSSLKTISISLISLPSFIASVFLQFIFAICFKLFPSTGYGSFYHLILPALSLSLVPAGVISRLFKSKLEDVLLEPYVLSAKAKGIGFFRLLIFHLMPGALLPTLSYLGPLAATLITGSFACEKVFAIPGLGSFFVSSLASRDYPLIAGLTLFYTFFVIAFSFLTDFLYASLDPKLKKELL